MNKIHQANLPFLLYICLVSALGGFLWGFDAIVISGTIDPVTTQFSLTSGMKGFFVSSGLIGAVIGSGLAGWSSDRFGRKKNLIFAALTMFISAAVCGMAGSIEALILARWIGGLGVGISAMICPLYISEISPAHLRGRLVTVFQFAITLGIVAALFSNYGMFQWADSLKSATGLSEFKQWFLVDETWRAMFATELIPGILFLLLAFTLPESPRWLAKQGNSASASLILKRIFTTGASEELSAIETTLAHESKTKKRFLDIFSPQYRKPLLVAAALAAFAQSSGINAVFYYGTSLLEKSGFAADSALSGMAIIGFFNMVFTLIAMCFVDKLGRKPLLQWGTVGAIFCLLGISSLIGSEASSLLIVFICGFVAFFAFSLGPIKFIFASEIFPTNIRAHAVSFVVLTMWTVDTIVGQLFPILQESMGASGVFLLFACILVPQLFLVWKWMPETAGKSLEEIESEMADK